MAQLRPLGEIIEVLEKIGFAVSYAFDDLIFIEHSHFMLRFDEENVRTLHFYAHDTTEENKQQELYHSIANQFDTIACTIVDAGTFNLKENKENENLDIHFYDRQGVAS